MTRRTILALLLAPFAVAVGPPRLATAADIENALETYGKGRAAGIRGMADNRGLNSAALTPAQYKALITEEAEWSERFASHPAVSGEEAAGELRHAAAMRAIASRIGA